MQRPSKFGKALARLATDPTLQDVTGKYYTGMKEMLTSEESYHEDKALDLWKTSVKLTGLPTKESSIIEV